MGLSKIDGFYKGISHWNKDDDEQGYPYDSRNLPRCPYHLPKTNHESPGFSLLDPAKPVGAVKRWNSSVRKSWISENDMGPSSKISAEFITPECSLQNQMWGENCAIQFILQTRSYNNS